MYSAVFPHFANLSGTSIRKPEALWQVYSRVSSLPKLEITSTLIQIECLNGNGGVWLSF